MLDQLVAFCGDTVALDDVLGIFGFTAPETVARLASNLLGRHTPGALLSSTNSPRRARTSCA